MAVAERYRRQVALLIRVVPFVAAETCFALKGGTAINLFVRDMPRLSVDIDLTYLPVADRDASLAAIDAAMRRIAESIRRGIADARVDLVALPEQNPHHPARHGSNQLPRTFLVFSSRFAAAQRARIA